VRSKVADIGDWALGRTATRVIRDAAPARQGNCFGGGKRSATN
jgi:hypothetical protein